MQKGISPPMIRDARTLSYGKANTAIIHDAGIISKIKICERWIENGSFFSVYSSKTKRYPPKRLENTFLFTYECLSSSTNS